MIFMRRYYYMTGLAAIAIVCIQALYIKSLYNDYRGEKITELDHWLSIAIDEELRSRNLSAQPVDGRSVVVKAMNDMTPQELDSLMRISKPGQPGDTINVDEARKKNIGWTTGDVIRQIDQDRLLRKGHPLNLDSLGQIFAAVARQPLTYQIIRYDRDTLAVDTVGAVGQRSWSYVAPLLPIGTEGASFLKLQAMIPWKGFVWQHAWPLVSSLGIVAIVLSCLSAQLTEIRRKNELLRERESAINGTIHDLKAPLNGVVTMLSWFKSSESDPRRRDLLEKGLENVKHLAHTIEMLLTIARKEDHRLALRKEAVDMPALVRRAIDELAFIYPGKAERVRVENRLPEGFRIQADALYIGSVIRNLVENALKYSDETVEVTVTLALANGQLLVTVKDTGWGIAKRHQKRLFTQFYQVPREPGRNRGGYGIGLAQARCVIKEHHGEIRVESEEGKGSTFSFTLPPR